jgi:hypothetical protein
MRTLRKPILSVLLSVVFLFSAAAAASNALHEVLHVDAKADHHVCLVSLFAHHQILSGDADLSFPIPSLVPVSFQVAEVSPTFPRVDVELAPSRAPPALLSSHQVVG